MPARSFVGASDTDRWVAVREPVEDGLFWGYVVALAWVPFWYASNDLLAWGVNAVLFPGLAICYEVSLLLRGKPHPIGVHVLRWPAGVFLVVIIWILCQTVTWSRAPIANPIWGMAANALGRRVPASISVDRDLTNLALLRLLTAASALWLSVQLSRNAARARRLVGAVAAIGAGYAAYGIVATRTGQLPLLDIVPQNGRVTSSFVNQNSFAAYAGLCLISAVGVVLHRYLGDAHRGAGNWRYHVASLLEISGTGGALPIAAGLIILTALLMTGSRGGVIAVGMALLVLCFLSGRGGLGQGKPAITATVFTLLLVLGTALAFGDTFLDHLERRGLNDPNRLAVYRLTLRSILDQPLAGYGYGTFARVFPMYRDRSLSVSGVWGQTHNTYLETMQGLGIVFGTLLIACIALLVLRCLKGSGRRREDAIVPQVAVSAAVLLGVNALVDFSMQIQAVALTWMALTGAGVAQSESPRAILDD